MKKLQADFFEAWEDEIAAYQEVALSLTRQKSSLLKWDIQLFQEASKEAAKLISTAHKNTTNRDDLMKTIFLINDVLTEKQSLRHIAELFEEDLEREKAEIFFKVFSNTLRNIDKLSKETKELIKTGLELVGDNLEMISDIIDRDRVYSRVGMISNKRSSILLNKRI